MQNQLKKLIKSRKIKIGELADKLGCNRSTLSCFLNNKGTVNSSLLFKLLDLLDVKLCIVVS